MKAIILSLLLIFGVFPGAHADEARAGGYRKVSTTNPEVVAAANFAIKARSHDKPPTTTQLLKILAAEEQIVAGKNFRLSLSVREQGAAKTVEAIVWWQAWRKPDPYQLTSWQVSQTQQ